MCNLANIVRFNTEEEKKIVFEEVTRDIKVNRIDYGKKTTLKDVISLMRITLTIVRRC
ncbi:hypothetical protein SAMN02745163_02089 [Clostridium cavendishii DSM 21758]|uniref:Uncharacterized protein n=1 Tax=Clostridium cavendishii DSM 21758 TaxID=1121302 RepID=A0A1M6K3Z0_9CLOT|nr:hypothetical protein [Clostridium cavendishii]SHJ53590.1 hypothetical protein SAMN02745163_02089 [Clostridium cavendishii DSM 21758]